MSKRHENGSGIWVWAGALLLALILYGLPKSYKNNLSDIVRSGLYSPFVWVDTQYRLMRDNLSRYIVTRRELAKTRNEVEQLRAIRIENQRLRNLLDFKNRSEHNLLLAEVIGSGAYRYPSALLISAGKDKGIEPDSPVLTADGIVGKVKSVGAMTSVVQILGDPSLHIAAMDRRSRTVGILESKDGKNLIFSQVPVGEYVAEGDKIITSGLGKIFPKGLLIGYVVSVLDPPAGMFKKIVIQPAANLNKLEELFILMDSKQDTTESE